MSSIIEGYNYDVFISYRQKDNKHDGWVTEFVNNLKGELESTFKEDISVYFDINPHDGLLETHDVDDSLKEKIKCLIFIPIISRTYCDPKSFAWEHEFKAFVEQASKDQFGLKVKLPNGNVASRVLPILIHGLDAEDIKECESLLSGVLRGVEFIYREPGVNKPLTADDDEKKNLNNTKFRIQINKVANAIKEVITAIEHHLKKPEEILKEIPNSISVLRKRNKKAIIAGVIILVALIIFGSLLIPKLFKSKEHLEKSIAVLPFINDSPDANDDNIPFINGLMEEIIINIQTIKELRVPGRTSVEKFRNNTTKSIPEIARELGVNYIVEGSGQKYGNTLRLRVQLIRAKGKEDHVWARSFEQEILEVKDIFNIQIQIAQDIAKELEAIITPREKQLIEKAPTENLAAYEAYLKGLYFYEGEEIGTDKSILWFKEAIKLDSTFSLPWTYLSMCYWRKTSTTDNPEFKKAKEANEKALELDPTSCIAIVNMAEILDNEYDFEGAEEKIKLALKIDPDNQYVLRNAGRFYTILGKGRESISFCNLALQNDPNNRTALYYLAKAYFYAGFFKEAWAVYNRYYEFGYVELSRTYYQLLLEEGKFDRIIKEQSSEGNESIHNVALAAAYFALGHKTEAEKICNKLKGENISAYWIAYIYAYGDDQDKVYEWLEKSYILREKDLIYIAVEPAFKKFRDEQRMKNLLQKMKLPVL